MCRADSPSVRSSILHITQPHILRKAYVELGLPHLASSLYFPGFLAA